MPVTHIWLPAYLSQPATHLEFPALMTFPDLDETLYQGTWYRAALQVMMQSLSMRKLIPSRINFNP